MNRHSRLTIILPLLLLFFTACIGNSDEEIISIPTAASSQSGTTEEASFPGVIFTADEIGASEHWPNNDDPWTPSEEDVMMVEERLTGYLQDENPDLWQKLDNYTRQYWGTVTPDGNRAVYATFFCDADRIASYLDWRKGFVMMLDGGDCYFQTLYDIEDGIFVWLAINGEA